MTRTLTCAPCDVIWQDGAPACWSCGQPGTAAGTDEKITSWENLAGKWRSEEPAKPTGTPLFTGSRIAS